jgi:6-pyruvoyltetrahydropterin/6-carboxytetrahydropterin synthase
VKYISTKEYKQIGPVAYRQWKADSHCSKIHGYALSFKFEFECDDLDVRNWAMDYGGLKPLRVSLEDWFDHTLLVAEDDPMKAELLRLGELKLAKITVVSKTGCEGIADFLYEYVNTIFLPNYGKVEAERLWCCKVEVRETDANMAMRVGHREDREFN